MQINDQAVVQSVHAHGHYHVTCLTPRPECMADFLPLWHARLSVTERLAELETRAEQLALRPPHKPNRVLSWLLPWVRVRARRDVENWMLDRTTLTERILIARAQVAALSEQMRPLQYERFVEDFDNLVTTVGKNDMLDKYLKGSTYTQTFVMGLCGTGTKAAADTQASHGGWSEVGGTNAPAFTGNRPAITLGSAAAGVSTSPSTSFAITSSGTVAGCFMNNGGSATKDNTSGVLFSAGDFTGGSQAVNNLDTLNIVWTLTLTSGA